MYMYMFVWGCENVYTHIYIYIYICMHLVTMYMMSQ